MRGRVIPQPHVSGDCQNRRTGYLHEPNRGYLKVRMKLRNYFLLFGAALLFSAHLSAAPKQCPTPLTFSCSAQNDLYLALAKAHYPRFETPLAAIQNATAGSAVLLLADDYPVRQTALDPAASSLPAKRTSASSSNTPPLCPAWNWPRPAPQPGSALSYRPNRFAPALPRMRILAAHDCHFVPVSGSPAADLVVARVAGYDTAVYGLPDKAVFPILFDCRSTS